jgi:hypothetical protein
VYRSIDRSSLSLFVCVCVCVCVCVSRSYECCGVSEGDVTTIEEGTKERDLELSVSPCQCRCRPIGCATVSGMSLASHQALDQCGSTRINQRLHRFIHYTITETRTTATRTITTATIHNVRIHTSTSNCYHSDRTNQPTNYVQLYYDTPPQQ